MTTSHSHRSAEVGYLILRLTVAFLFLFHAPQKWFGWYVGTGATGRPEELFSLRWFASLTEAVSSPLIALGLFTSYAAFFAAAEMVAAYFLVHWYMAPEVVKGLRPYSGFFWPIENRGELSVLYFLVFVYILLKGGGEYSLDARRQRRAAMKRTEGSTMSSTVMPMSGSRKAV